MQLIAENPDLPIIPFVDGEMVLDDYGYWMGSWGDARVDEYIIPEDCYPVQYKSDNDVTGTLEICLPFDELEVLPEDDESWRLAYENLPWKKAIIIYINLPDE